MVRVSFASIPHRGVLHNTCTSNHNTYVLVLSAPLLHHNNSHHNSGGDVKNGLAINRYPRRSRNIAIGGLKNSIIEASTQQHKVALPRKANDHSTRSQRHPVGSKRYHHWTAPSPISSTCTTFKHFRRVLECSTRLSEQSVPPSVGTRTRCAFAKPLEPPSSILRLGFWRCPGLPPKKPRWCWY